MRMMIREFKNTQGLTFYKLFPMWKYEIGKIFIKNQWVVFYVFLVIKVIPLVNYNMQ